MKNKFLKEMQDRGLLNQCTDLDKLGEICNKKSISGYIGFDCTASSLHVGSLLQIMILKLMQKYGHQPIVLLGGGTTLIGDPSGKDTTRKILDQNEINNNIKSIKKVFNKILDTSNKNTSPIYVDNADWLNKLNYIQFLRDTGSHFTINKMLTFDSVKLRLDREQSLSYMEFNYMILQAYDFLELNKKKSCSLQIGGSDQWGNIVNGTELIKRYSGKQVYGLTTPLITVASGAKMGKTESGAVWLDEKLLSSYDYWQFWRNVDDRDVIKFLKMFTDLDIREIERMKNNNINELKTKLANEATSMLHGKKAAKNSEQAAKEAFSGNLLGSKLPSIKINFRDIEKKITIVDLVILSNLEKSKSEIRRLIYGNAIRLNDKIISDDKLIISDELFSNNYIKLSVGKKRHIKVVLD